MVKFQNFVPKVYIETPIDVVVLKRVNVKASLTRYRRWARS